MPIVLIDTAGIRKSSDPVELEGVRRSLREVSNCDLIIKVNDVVENIDFKERQISVFNKNDITKHPKILFKDSIYLHFRTKN